MPTHIMESIEEHEAKIAEMIKSTLENRGLAEWDLIDTMFEDIAQ